jgi:hypothetical protein
MGEHARLSPSGLKNLDPASNGCSGRLRMVEQLPPEERNTESQASIDGTRRHDQTYQLNVGRTPVYESPEDKRLVERAWEFFRAHPARTHPEGLWLPEQRVEVGQHLGIGEGVCWGTADLIAAYKDTVEVVDAKFGRMPVSPLDPQLKAYGFGGVRLLLQDDGNWLPNHRQTKFIKLTIVQPQLPEMVVTTGPLPLAESLAQWKEELTTIAKAALDPEAPLLASEDNCRFCPAKRICPAYTAQTQRDVTAMFTDLTRQTETPELPPQTEPTAQPGAGSMLEILENRTTAAPEELTPDELGRVLDLAPLVQSWFKECETVASKRLKAGQPVEGWKLIEGRGSRDWAKDEPTVAAELKKLGAKVADIYVKKLVSPAQAAKLPVFTTHKAKADKLLPLIMRKAGKPTLAPESDPHPGVDPLHGMFEDVSAPAEPETPDWF